MRILNIVSLGVCLLVGGACTASAEVQLALNNGRVSLVAKDATVRQILTEWARVGQTKIVNVERIPGGPVTLQFTSVPEEDVLDVLLRSMSGYLAARRPTPVANLSRYDRIMVMPNVAVPRTTSAAVPSPVFQQPRLQVTPPDDDDQGQAAPSIVTPARGPTFQTFPQPQIVNPPQNVNPQQGAGAQPLPTDQALPAAAYPGASTIAGSPRPGMATQPAAPPGQAQPGSAAPRPNN